MNFQKSNFVTSRSQRSAKVRLPKPNNKWLRRVEDLLQQPLSPNLLVEQQKWPFYNFFASSKNFDKNAFTQEQL